MIIWPAGYASHILHKKRQASPDSETLEVREEKKRGGVGRFILTGRVLALERNVREWAPHLASDISKHPNKYSRPTLSAAAPPRKIINLNKRL